MPTIITDGAASAQGYGFAARTAAANYIEDVFSTYLYTGNGSTQTITNGIDLSTYGGLVWVKCRSTANDHLLYDTSRGANNALITNSASGTGGGPNQLTSFTTAGFTLGSDSAVNSPNRNLETYVSWTFRKQAKFFDVVTYTGNGALSRQISHNLGSAPGAVLIKSTSTTKNWVFYSNYSGSYFFNLNNTNARIAAGSATLQRLTTTFTVCTGETDPLNDTNTNGVTYVAYLFAHDAGGFGASGSDNVISCGSYTGTGASVTVNLGYEPQWVLVKKATGSTAGAGWRMYDNMRGMPVGGNDALLSANLTDAEVLSVNDIEPTATGFIANSNISSSTDTYIYIAIRRGPMKTPTTGTSVFSPIASSAATGTALTTGFPVDMQIFSLRTGTTNKGQTVDRLRGVSSTTTESGAQLITNSTAAETTGNIPTRAWNNTGFQMPSSYGGTSEIFWNFRRAPGFFDMVCYTGTGSAITINHNLSVIPELIIYRRRNAADNWSVFTQQNGFGTLNSTSAWGGTGNGSGTNTIWQASATSVALNSIFAPSFAASGSTNVIYLFATCPGVSKVGSYTGTDTTKQIDCGFTGGARFVLIKRTDSTGDWYVWDSARGIVAGNDPYLLLNSTAAEVTSTDYVDTYSAGFEISSTAPAAINANGGSFIFLAIA